MNTSELTYIYGLFDPRDNRLRYVGKADNLHARLGKHIRYARKNTSTHKDAWIHGLLDAGVSPVIIPLMQVPQRSWKEVERALIKRLREKGYNLVNTAEGGDGGVTRPPGWTHTEESRRKSAKSQEGRWTEEEREEWRNRAKSQWSDPEFRQRQSEGWNKPGVKDKVSKSQKRRWESEEARIRQGLVGKRNGETPEITQKMSDSAKAHWRDPEYRAKHRDGLINHWIERKRKRLAANGQMNLFEIKEVQEG